MIADNEVSNLMKLNKAADTAASNFEAQAKSWQQQAEASKAKGEIPDGLIQVEGLAYKQLMEKHLSFIQAFRDRNNGLKGEDHDCEAYIETMIVKERVKLALFLDAALFALGDAVPKQQKHMFTLIDMIYEGKDVAANEASTFGKAFFKAYDKFCLQVDEIFEMLDESGHEPSEVACVFFDRPFAMVFEKSRRQVISLSMGSKD